MVKFRCGLWRGILLLLPVIAYGAGSQVAEYESWEEPGQYEESWAEPADSWQEPDEVVAAAAQPSLSSDELNKSLKQINKDFEQGVYSSEQNRKKYEAALGRLAELAYNNLSQLTKGDFAAILNSFAVARKERPKDRSTWSGLSPDTDRRRKLLIDAISAFYATDELKRLWKEQGLDGQFIAVYSTAFNDFPSFSRTIQESDLLVPAAEQLQVIRKNLADKSLQGAALDRLTVLFTKKDSDEYRVFSQALGLKSDESKLLAGALISQLSSAVPVMLARSLDAARQLLTIFDVLATKHATFPPLLAAEANFRTGFNAQWNKLAIPFVPAKLEQLLALMDSKDGYPQAAQQFIDDVVPLFEYPQINLSDDIVKECYKVIQAFKKKLKWESTHVASWSENYLFWSCEWLFKRILGQLVGVVGQATEPLLTAFIDERSSTNTVHSPVFTVGTSTKLIERLRGIDQDYATYVQQYAFMASLMPIKNQLDSKPQVQIAAMNYIASFVTKEKFGFNNWPKECAAFLFEVFKKAEDKLTWTSSWTFKDVSPTKIFEAFRDMNKAALENNKMFCDYIGSGGKESLASWEERAQQTIDKIKGEAEQSRMDAQAAANKRSSVTN